MQIISILSGFEEEEKYPTLDPDPSYFCVGERYAGPAPVLWILPLDHYTAHHAPPLRLLQVGHPLAPSKCTCRLVLLVIWLLI